VTGYRGGMLNLCSVYSNVRHLCALLCPAISCPAFSRPSFSCPAISCPANWSVNFTSVIFTSCIFSAPPPEKPKLKIWMQSVSDDDVRKRLIESHVFGGERCIQTGKMLHLPTGHPRSSGQHGYRWLIAFMQYMNILQSSIKQISV